MACVHVSRLQPWSVFFIGAFIIQHTSAKKLNSHLPWFVAAVYAWSCIFKFNPWYKQLIVPDIEEAIMNLFSTSHSSGFIHTAINILPAVTLVILILSFIRIFSKWAALFFILYHAGVIVVLGVWKNNANYVIWPWNFSLLLYWWYVFFSKNNYDINFSGFNLKLPAFYVLSWIFLFPLTWFSGFVSSTACMHLYSGMGNEAFIPAQYVNRQNASIWSDNELFYAVSIDYMQFSGVPFPDAPDNFRHAERKLRKQKIIKGGKMRIEKYTFSTVAVSLP
jgi:hypothetical protein